MTHVAVFTADSGLDQCRSDKMYSLDKFIELKLTQGTSGQKPSLSKQDAVQGKSYTMRQDDE
jgi:cytochrome c